MSTSLPLLPSDVMNHLHRDFLVPFIPAGVCKEWNIYRCEWQNNHAKRIQRLYRIWIQFYKKAEYYHTIQTLIRMYMVHYPIYFLQRWPDLAMRKCSNMTQVQRDYCNSLPPTEERTKRHIRDLMQTMDISQIMYVGW